MKKFWKKKPKILSFDKHFQTFDQHDHHTGRASFNPIYIAISIIVAVIAIYAVAYALDDSFVTPLEGSDEESNPDMFIGERAREYLKKLTDVGPRVTGSDANENTAVAVLLGILAEAQAINIHQQMEHYVAIWNGRYLYKENQPYVYEGIQGVVVRMKGLKFKRGQIIVNAHFDSVPTSPGAMDDGFMCAIMLEIISKMVKSTKRFDHDIIFLFNGGEEAGLLGAHGFVTNEKLLNASIIINLDAAGYGVKEMLFQSGPKNIWLNDYYVNIPRPSGQAIGEEIFQANLIPSDTDYRVFKEIAGMPGFDVAIATNGYRYHNRLDDFEHIPSKAFQHVGENVYSLITMLANAPEVVERPNNNYEKTIFFDLFGWFMICYTEMAAIWINAFTIIFSVLIACFAFHRFGILRPSWENVKYTTLTTIFILLSWTLGVLISYLLALFFDAIGYTMSWFDTPILLFGLYSSPCIIFACIPLILLKKYAGLEEECTHTHAQLQMHLIRLIFTIALLVLTILKIRSSYLIANGIFFNSIAFLIIILIRKDTEHITWQIVYLIAHIFPTIFVFYLTNTIFSVFIPIMGRNGPDTNPDILIGILTAALTILVFSYIIPFITTLTEKPFYILAILFAPFLLFFIFIFTPIGYPYSADFFGPAPQRYTIYHMKRITYDIDTKKIFSDSGYYSVNYDRNSPKSIADYVEEFQNVEDFSALCPPDMLFCGLPTESSKNKESFKYGSWIVTTESPDDKNKAILEMTKKEVNETDVKFHFKLSGPDRIGISFSPHKGCKLVKTSLLKNLPSNPIKWNDRDSYLINYVYGIQTEDLQFSIELEKANNNSGFYLDIAITTKFLHDVSYTKEYLRFISRFPDWTVVQPYVAIFESYVF